MSFGSPATALGYHADSLHSEALVSSLTDLTLFSKRCGHLGPEDALLSET